MRETGESARTGHVGESQSVGVGFDCLGLAVELYIERRDAIFNAGRVGLLVTAAMQQAWAEEGVAVRTLVLGLAAEGVQCAKER